MISKVFLTAFAVLIAAYLYSRISRPANEPDPLEDNLERNIIAAWAEAIREPTRKFQRIAVGINSNLDIIVPAIDLLQALNATPGRKNDYDVLDSIEKLQENFALYFTKGSAAERYFGNAGLYREIVKTAESLADVKSFIGGNAALMANKVAQLYPDTTIQFVGPVGKELLRLFPSSVSVPEQSIIPQDEVHLIMEYKVGERWGDDVTPVANRFITSHDESNSQATMLETFFGSLDKFSPDLVLMSGLHMLESIEFKMFRQRIQIFVDGLEQIPLNVPVHLELASMAKEDYLRVILDKVIPKITSLGLNEQEIAFSSATGGGPHVEMFYKHSGGQPEIEKISDMILWLLKTYGRSDQRPESRLTRVHFHSLTYHIVGALPGVWENIESSVAAGARLAGRQACDIRMLSTDKVDLKIPRRYKRFSEDKERTLDGNKPIISWDRGGFHFALSPVLVCKHPEKTVGLGDSISSTGLMYSEFNPNFNK